MEKLNQNGSVTLIGILNDIRAVLQNGRVVHLEVPTCQTKRLSGGYPNTLSTCEHNHAQPDAMGEGKKLYIVGLYKFHGALHHGSSSRFMAPFMLKGSQMARGPRVMRFINLLELEICAF